MTKNRHIEIRNKIRYGLKIIPQINKKMVKLLLVKVFKAFFFEVNFFANIDSSI